MCEKDLLVRDLTECYFRILRAHPQYTRMEICSLISQMPAPRYYRSLSYAQKIIRHMAAGKPRASSYHMRDMHKDLYSRWLALPNKTDENLAQLLASPAPSFYLSKHRINKLLYRTYGRIY